MSETMQTSANAHGRRARNVRNAGNVRTRWTRERTAVLGLVCLVAGTAGGWSIRGMRAIGTGEYASGGRCGETGDGTGVTGTQSYATEGNGGYAGGAIAGQA